MFLNSPGELPASGGGGGGGEVPGGSPPAVRPRAQPELPDGGQAAVQSGPSQPSQVQAGAQAAAVPVLQRHPSPAVLRPS